MTFKDDVSKNIIRFITRKTNLYPKQNTSLGNE